MLEDALSKLYTLNIQSIIIEGGPKTLQLFIDNNIWNEAHVFTSNQIWHNGIKAPLFTDAKLQHQQLNLSDNYQLFKPNI
jgi:diaminohydroxyphosphoribosylaminopyrimidine deaminase/5-amino-6-(5-phosphoribosylamino)uracil reductase